MTFGRRGGISRHIRRSARRRSRARNEQRARNRRGEGRKWENGRGPSMEATRANRRGTEQPLTKKNTKRNILDDGKGPLKAPKEIKLWREEWARGMQMSLGQGRTGHRGPTQPGRGGGGGHVGGYVPQNPRLKKNNKERQREANHPIKRTTKRGSTMEGDGGGFAGGFDNGKEGNQKKGGPIP